MSASAHLTPQIDAKTAIKRRFAARNAVHSDGPGARAMTRILSPSFGALVFDPKPMFWTLRHVFHSIISIFQPGLLYMVVYGGLFRKIGGNFI